MVPTTSSEQWYNTGTQHVTIRCQPTMTYTALTLRNIHGQTSGKLLLLEKQFSLKDRMLIACLIQNSYKCMLQADVDSERM